LGKKRKVYFTCCANLFLQDLPSVEFADYIRQFEVAHVRKFLTGPDGKPVSLNAVYKWQRGESCPEGWEQVLIMNRLGNPPAPSSNEKKGRGRPRKPVQ